MHCLAEKVGGEAPGRTFWGPEGVSPGQTPWHIYVHQGRRRDPDLDGAVKPSEPISAFCRWERGERDRCREAPQSRTGRQWLPRGAAQEFALQVGSLWSLTHSATHSFSHSLVLLSIHPGVGWLSSYFFLFIRPLLTGSYLPSTHSSVYPVHHSFTLRSTLPFNLLIHSPIQYPSV